MRDLDEFYSETHIDQLKMVLGESLHFHFGCFRNARDSLEQAQQQTVTNFFPYIPNGASVLDAGCGWGGPAQILQREHQCQVLGLTISKAQRDYCRGLGLAVDYCDLEQAVPKDAYDVIFMLEVLSHIKDKEALLRRLHPLAPRLVLSVNCLANHFKQDQQTYGDSMLLCTVSNLQNYLQAAGWRILYQNNRRSQAMLTLGRWQKNLSIQAANTELSAFLKVLQAKVDHALKDPVRWALNFPIIDIVAERAG